MRNYLAAIATVAALLWLTYEWGYRAGMSDGHLEGYEAGYFAAHMKIKPSEEQRKRTDEFAANPSASAGLPSRSEEMAQSDGSSELAPPVPAKSAHQALENLGEAFQTSADISQQRKALQQKFEAVYDPQQSDWQSETNIADFFELHPQRDAIELYKLQCTASDCLLLGQYDGEHGEWQAVVEQMQATDWWQHPSTSHTSSSDNGMTYFRLFVSRSE